MGESGAGKSTLIQILGILKDFDSGELIIDGKNVEQLNSKEKALIRNKKIGFVFQNYNLLPLMNVYENIVLPIKLDGIKPDDDYVEEILKLLKLEDKKIPVDIDYDKISNLASEARQKLKEVNPTSIGQALRISGVNPADISILMIYLRKEYYNAN